REHERAVIGQLAHSQHGRVLVRRYRTILVLYAAAEKRRLRRRSGPASRDPALQRLVALLLRQVFDQLLEPGIDARAVDGMRVRQLEREVELIDRERQVAG